MASFLTVVSLIQRDTTTVSVELVASFSADLLTFLSSNNPTALQSGILALNKTQFGKRVKEVLTACKLPAQGFAGGALTGTKWRDQPEEVTGPILVMHSSIVADFQGRLEVAGLFDKKVQTDAQKAESKAKRDAKQSDAIASAIAARGLVDPTTLPELAPSAQVDCVLALLDSGVLDSDNVEALLRSVIAAVADSDLSKAYAKHARAAAAAAAVPMAD